MGVRCLLCRRDGGAEGLDAQQSDDGKPKELSTFFQKPSQVAVAQEI